MARTDADLLGRALDRLPVDQRTILVLHHLEGRDLAGLAEILEIPLGTVKSRLYSARQAFRAAMAAEDRAR
jgi:RNA polymerase sigma-70 factor (ECF subfamily)